MKAFATIKTGYAYSNHYGWRGDYYKIIIINDNTTMTYNVIVGYEGIQPTEEHLKKRGYKELYTGISIYGQVKKKDYNYYQFQTLEDIKRDIKLHENTSKRSELLRAKSKIQNPLSKE